MDMLTMFPSEMLLNIALLSWRKHRLIRISLLLITLPED